MITYREAEELFQFDFDCKNGMGAAESLKRNVLGTYYVMLFSWMHRVLKDMQVSNEGVEE